MLTQLFLAAREEGAAPLPYVRQIIRTGLTASAPRLEAISPELATQFLDVEFSEANFSDRLLALGLDDAVRGDATVFDRDRGSLPGSLLCT